jgi:hypothetical protein
MKMTLQKTNTTILLLLSVIVSAFSQSPGYPSIDWAGTIFDEYDHVIGWISKDGVVQSTADDRIAVIDKTGNAFDGKGQRIGKMEKDGSFVNPHGQVLFELIEKDDQFRLIDPEGKIIGFVHPRYKNQAVAISCIYARNRAR